MLQGLNIRFVTINKHTVSDMYYIYVCICVWTRHYASCCRSFLTSLTGRQQCIKEPNNKQAAAAAAAFSYAN